MKRIAFVGLSTPIYYDYRYQASKTNADIKSSPNPILEGAFGTMLLYDEIWFLTRSLCPENMRHLNYIKFLDEIESLPKIDPEWLNTEDEVFNKDNINEYFKSSGKYEEVKKSANIYWDAGADNHTHNLNVNGYTLNGNSWNIDNVIYDMLIADRLPSNVEFMTNSFSSRLFKSESKTNDKLILAELLVINNVIEHLTPKGPYHESLEELRNSAYLENFRKWIIDDISLKDNQEVQDVKEEIESKLMEDTNRIILKALDPSTIKLTGVETLYNAVTDTFIPYYSNLKKLVGLPAQEREMRDIRWQGLIHESKQILK